MGDDGHTGTLARLEQRVDLPAGLAARIGPDTCVAYVSRLRLGAGAYYPGTLARTEQWLGAAVRLKLAPTRDALIAVPTHTVAEAAAPRALLTSGSKWPEDDE